MDTNTTPDAGSAADYRSMRRHLFALAIGGALLVVVGVQLASFLLSRSLMEDGYERLQQQLVDAFRQDIRQTLDHHAGHLQILLHNPILLDAIRQGDREALMREVYWQYELKRRENPHIEVLHFHNPDNITLLRLHQPAKYGDDLSEVRPMIAEANHLRERREGFEIGKNGISYRVAVPIYDGDDYLGLVELGLNVSYFTERLSDMYGVAVGIFFHRAAMQTYLAQHGEEGMLVIGQDIVAFAPMSELLHEAGYQQPGAGELYRPFEFEGGRYVAYQVMSLSNFSKQEVGNLVVVADVSEQVGLIWNNALWSSSAWVVLLLVLILGQYRIFSRMQDTIHNLAFYDELTRLPNRRLLMDRLQQSLLNCARSRQRLALLFVDLDNFKQLNDTRGHHVGDSLLQQVAERLRNSVRANDTVARQGGDEFVIVLEGLDADRLHATEQAALVAEKIVCSLNIPYELGDGLSWQCTASIGIALCDDNRIDMDELMRRADVAMYRAKSAGRNQVVFFSTPS